MRCGPRGRRERLRGRQGAGAPARRLRSRVSPIFVGSSFVAKYPEGGGNFWVPLQYLLGLRALGHDAWWVEILTSGDAATGRRAIEVFRRHVEALGVADRVVLGHVTDGTRNDRPGCVEWIGLPEAELDARARDGVLLNFANSL